MSGVNDTALLGIDHEFAYTVEMDFYIWAAEVLLYGAYAVLFGFYVRILLRGDIRGAGFLQLTTIALFVLSTVHVTLLIAASATVDVQLNTAFLVGANPPQRYLDVATRFSAATTVVYVTSNVAADGIFVFRCYAIWGFRRKIIIFPIFCTFAVAVFGYLDAGMATLASFSIKTEDNIIPATAHLILWARARSSMFFMVSTSISLATTVLLMILSAGRIWWLARRSFDSMGNTKTMQRYYTVVAMILESGALYALGGVILLALFLLGRNPHFSNGIILAQLVGIAPTIITVRVGLGKSVESVPVSSFAVMTQPAAASRHPQAPGGLVFGVQTSTTQSIEQQAVYLCPATMDHRGKAEAV